MTKQGVEQKREVNRVLQQATFDTKFIRFGKKHKLNPRTDVNSTPANPLKDKCNLFLKAKERENVEDQRGPRM